VRGHGLSIQAFNILPKIREVDRVMTPALQQQVYEAHPELAFQSLAGHPLQDRKKTVAGREARLHVLETIPGLLFHGIRGAFEQALHTCKRTDVAPDDILDAYVLMWTALRIRHAQAYRVPRIPPHDARGLRMEIWY
jgi:predicted RNase H-like nuclease